MLPGCGAAQAPGGAIPNNADSIAARELSDLDAAKTAIILDFIDRRRPLAVPIRSLIPVIQPGDTDWRDYYSTLNAPHCYHNGGILAVHRRIYIAALVKAGRLTQVQKPSNN